MLKKLLFTVTALTAFHAFAQNALATSAAIPASSAENADQIQLHPVVAGIPKSRVAIQSNDQVDVLDFGADPHGARDSSAAFANAMAALGPRGGIVNFRGWFLIDRTLNIPDNVVLRGAGISAGQHHDGKYRPETVPSALVLNPAHTIVLNSRDGVMDTLVINAMLAPNGEYPLPFANAGIAGKAIAAFSGTAFTPTAQNFDQRLENLLVLGFDYLYDGRRETESNRPLFRRVYGDNKNGIFVTNVGDVGRGEDLHMWPFTTANQPFSESSLYLRPGTAFSTGRGSTWMTWKDAFEYGYQIGHSVDGSQDVRQIACGADSPPDLRQANIGFIWQGSLANAACIACTATAQGNTGFLLDTIAQNRVNDVRLIGPIAHGNNSANGYVDVRSGTWSISSGFFDDNGRIGQIHVGPGAGAGTISDTTFGNLTNAKPLFGDATAINRVQTLNVILTGVVSPTTPQNTLSNLTVNGTTYLGGTPGKPGLSVPAIDDAANALEVIASAANQPPTIAATGADASIPINLAPKGSAAVLVNGVPLRATLAASSGLIGGAQLGAGACTTESVTVRGATAAMVVAVSPTTYPGDGFYWQGYVAAPSTVAIKLCAVRAGTPRLSAYNIRIIQ